MSLVSDNGRAVHYPADPDKFAFDAEVSDTFDDMARRSIPNYTEIHRLHLSMLGEKLHKGAVILDVGSSTGELFRVAHEVLGETVQSAGIRSFAIDDSPYMIRKLRERYPYVEAIEGRVPRLPDLPVKADIVFCFYLFQFIPKGERLAAYDWVIRNLKPDGVLVLGQKECLGEQEIERLYTKEYYRFRRANGYTQQEIDAKTVALRNSMWTETQQVQEHRARFFERRYIETSRWLQFTTGIVVRR